MMCKVVHTSTGKQARSREPILDKLLRKSNLGKMLCFALISEVSSLDSGIPLANFFIPVNSRHPPKGQESMFLQFAHSVVCFLKSEEGPTAVEYDVMLALIIVICLADITALGTSANETFGNTAMAIGCGS